MPDRRSQILRAAARCIARDGVRGLRVTDVAAEAGVSPGLLYYHFTDRAGLLGATVDHINDHANDVRGRGLPPASSPAEDLERQLLSELADDEEVRDNTAAWNELRALAVFEPDLREPLRRTTDAWVADLAHTVTTVRGDADTETAGRAAVLLTALVEGLSLRWLAGDLTLAEAHGLLAEAAERLVGADPAATPDRAVPTDEETS